MASKLAEKRRIDSFEFLNTLHWALFLEFNSKQNPQPVREIFEKTYRELQQKCGTLIWQTVQESVRLREMLQALSSSLRCDAEYRNRQVDEKKKLMREQIKSGKHKDLFSFEELPLPHQPEIKVTGLVPDECTIFKSNTQPLKLVFNTSEGQQVPVIYKDGDDLRQDQLIVQMIKLIDSLLKRVNLDFEFTPYRVLAFSCDDGIMEFVPSMTIQEVSNVEEYLKT